MILQSVGYVVRSITANVCIDAIMNIQLIDKQKGKYTLLINGVECVFMPFDLFVGNNLFPAKSFVPKGKSVLMWKVNGKQVSYNKIRKAIKQVINDQE